MSVRLHADLVEAAIELGQADALGSYPAEHTVFAACVSRAVRPVAVSDRLVSGLADVYDEARATREQALEAELSAADNLSLSHA